MRNISKPVLIGGGAVFTAVVAFVAFGIFGVQGLFIDDVVDEANPFEVVAEAAPANDAPAEEASAASEPAVDDEPNDEMTEEAETEEPVEEAEPETPEIITLNSGTFGSNNRYTTIGTATTITDGNQIFLRFEGFETSNGPDVNVYLRNSDDPEDYIDLGDLKGNIGDQNYELTADIDLERYDLVDIWCVRFSSSFGDAQLVAT